MCSIRAGPVRLVCAPTRCNPLLLHYPNFELYRKQVVKQADVTLAMYLRGDAFTT
jgi:alpha,alpha-trehalose phosphorylase